MQIDLKFNYAEGAKCKVAFATRSSSHQPDVRDARIRRGPLEVKGTDRIIHLWNVNYMLIQGM